LIIGASPPPLGGSFWLSTLPGIFLVKLLITSDSSFQRENCQRSLEVFY
jgi:hypothetical protein